MAMPTKFVTKNFEVLYTMRSRKEDVFRGLDTGVRRGGVLRESVYCLMVLRPSLVGAAARLKLCIGSEEVYKKCR